MSKAMGKEVKIGLAVIGSLLAVLGGVLYFRLANGERNAVAQAPDAPPGAASPSAAPAQPTLMTPAAIGDSPYGVDPASVAGAPERPSRGRAGYDAANSSYNDPASAASADGYPAENYPVENGAGPRQRQEPPQSYLADPAAAAMNDQPPEADSELPAPADRRSPLARNDDMPIAAEDALAGESPAPADGSADAAGSYAAPNAAGIDDPQAAQPPAADHPSAEDNRVANPFQRTPAADESAVSGDSAGAGDPAASGVSSPARNDPADDRVAVDPLPARPAAAAGFVAPRRFRSAGGEQTVPPPSGYMDEPGDSDRFRSAPDSAPSAGQPPIVPVTAEAPIAEGGERGQYVVQPNDNFWTIAEKVYGAGAFFKALQRFNAADYPQARRLQVGDVVAVPPIAALRQKFPDLCPKPNRERVASQTQPVSAGPQNRLGARIYTVEQGDTLFDVARRQLGKASRWPEIYELNRTTLGEDFHYLRPGTELVMPSDGERSQDTLTRQPSDRYQR